MTTIVTFLAILMVFTVTVLSGLWFIRQENPHFHERNESFVNGLFIGIGLFHLLPDAINNIKIAVITFSLLLVYGLFILGFLFLLVLDYAVKHRSVSTSGINFFSGSLVMILLSLHSIIGGLAMGLNPQLSDKILLLIAILAHKVTDSFALVINLRRSAFSRALMTSLMCIFAWMTPLGIGLAYWLVRHLSAQPLTLCMGIFNGLAAGTFIYIGTQEGSVRQLLIGKQRSLQVWFPLVFGLSLMGILARWH